MLWMFDEQKILFSNRKPASWSVHHLLNSSQQWWKNPEWKTKGPNANPHCQFPCIIKPFCYFSSKLKHVTMSFWITLLFQKLLHRLCSPAEGLPIMSHWPILPQEYRIINLPHQRLRHPGHCLLTPTSLARSRVGRTHCVFSVVLRHARCSSPRPSWTLAIVQPWQNKSHRKRQEIRRFDHVFCSIFQVYIYIYIYMGKLPMHFSGGQKHLRYHMATIQQNKENTQRVPGVVVFFTFVVSCFCNLVVTVT